MRIRFHASYPFTAFPFLSFTLLLFRNRPPANSYPPEPVPRNISAFPASSVRRRNLLPLHCRSPGRCICRRLLFCSTIGKTVPCAVTQAVPAAVSIPLAQKTLCRPFLIGNPFLNVRSHFSVSYRADHIVSGMRQIEFFGIFTICGFPSSPYS